MGSQLRAAAGWQQVFSVATFSLLACVSNARVVRVGPDIFSGGRAQERLLKRADAGNQRARDLLVREIWRRSYVVALAVLRDPSVAEDAAQEASTAALRGLGGFDRGRALGPWVHRIAVNASIDLARRTRSIAELVPDVFAAGEVKVSSDTELSYELSLALGRIDERSRAAMVLRYVLGSSAREVGEALGITEVNARTVLHRAARDLRSELSSIKSKEAG